VIFRDSEVFNQEKFQRFSDNNFAAPDELIVSVQCRKLPWGNGTLGLLKAARESTILPGMRSREGAHNVYGSLRTVLDSDPKNAIAVANVLRDRFSEIDDGYMVKLVAEPPKGLLQLIDKQTDASRKELTDILYGQYVPEMQKRMKTGNKGDKASLVNALLETIKLKKKIAGWKPIGTPAYPDRIWRYCAFNPLTEKDKLDMY